MKHFISLGAGTQSSTVAIMAALEEIEPMPDGAIFADTGAEPSAVYHWLNWLEQSLPFPVYRVSAGNLLTDMLNTEATRTDNPPFFAGTGMLIRGCTQFYKLNPIRRKVKELADGDSAVIWIGISTDEAHRMKYSPVKWMINRWPLIEKRMSRGDCIAWMARHGYPTPPKSACTFCPYHSDDMWRRMKETDTQSFAQAVTVDEAIRNAKWGVNNQLFVHRSRKPLSEVDFSRGGQADMFGEECEGMCGV